MSSGISLDEQLAELARLEREGQDGPEGFTMSDVAARYGCSHRGASYRVSEWVRMGLVEYAGKRRVVNICGGASLVPVYRRCVRSVI